MDYANTTNVEFIVDPKVLFHGWLIYSYLQIFKLIKCKWLPGECADWFFDNIMTWSYCLHRRYSMSRQKNSILINEHALNSEPVPLRVRSVTQTSILVGIRRLRLLWLQKQLLNRSGCLSLLWKSMWTTATLKTFTNNTTLILTNMFVFYS